MSEFTPQVTLPVRYWGGLDVLQDNAATDHLKIVRAAAHVFSPMALDTSNVNEVTVAASGVAREDVYCYLRQEVVARPSIRSGSKTLPNAIAYTDDMVQCSSGEMLCEIGSVPSAGGVDAAEWLYSGTVTTGDLLGWDGTAYVVTATAALALLQADSDGVSGTDRLRVKVLLPGQPV